MNKVTDFLKSVYGVAKGVTLKLSEFFQDQTGALSATRLAFLGVTGVVLAVAVKTAQASGWKADLHFDPSSLYLIGVLMVGKVAQSFSENKAITTIPGA